MSVDDTAKTSNGFGASSKMILQDRPAVLDTIPQELVPGIEKWDTISTQSSLSRVNYPQKYSMGLGS